MHYKELEIITESVAMPLYLAFSIEGYLRVTPARF
jgi:hypothetical protein